MNLLLNRDGAGETCTHGRLYIDQIYQCYTLEDKDRFLEKGGKKAPGQTAIPRGTYKVVIDHSQRFGKDMPHILNVPGFEGVRIHSGNTAADTEGCILVGKVRGNESVLDSRNAYEALFAKMQDAIARGEYIALEVR